MVLCLPIAGVSRAEEDPGLTVVLVPGVTGSALRHRESGDMVWGTGARVVGPRDGGRGLFLPLDTRPSDPTELEATEVIEELSLALVFRKPIYGPVLDRLEKEGFVRGDLRHPRPQDRLFAFAYDWRRDAILTAQLLAERLDEVRARQGVGKLRLALICQSNGGQICRYLARFGGMDLAAAEAGERGPPSQFEVEHLVLVGSAAGGSLRILRELNRGRRYLGGLGRLFEPEVLFSFPSLYQELPVSGVDLFMNAEGEDMAIDLYSFDSWQRYGWSIYSPEIMARKREKGRDPALGTDVDRRRFLSETLARAKRFRRLLASDAPLQSSTRVHLVGSTSTSTPSRAQLRRNEKGHWQTFFIGDPELERLAGMVERSSLPGDGHATLASLRALSPPELAAATTPPLLVDASHFEMIIEPRVLDFMASVLGSPGR